MIGLLLVIAAPCGSATATIADFCSHYRIWNDQTVRAHFSFEGWFSQVVQTPCRVVDCTPKGRCHKAGLLTLAGNVSAHADAVRCAIGENAPLGSDARYLLEEEHWERLSCADGCHDLVKRVANVLKQRDAMWTVLIIERAEKADPQVVANLLLDFVEGGGKCKHSAAESVVSMDCSRALLVLSTDFGSGLLDAAPERSMTSSSLPLTRSKLEKRVKDGAQRWFRPTGVQDYGKNTRGRLMSNLRVAQGEPPATLLDAYIRRAEQQQQQRRDEHEGASCDEAESGGGVSSTFDDVRLPRLGASGPLGKLVGQSYVLRAINKTLAELAASEESGGASALPEVFFFYGSPGAGKTYLARLIAEAYHGSSEQPFFGEFKMQSYKDVRDQKRLTGAGCDLVGGGVPELEHFYGGVADVEARLPADETLARRWGRYGGHGKPVLLFDEIEHGFDGVMNMLQAGIDGKWSYQVRDPSDQNRCPGVARPTAGTILILTSNCYQEELSAVTQAVKLEVSRQDDEQRRELAKRCSELCDRADEPCLVACEVEARMTHKIIHENLACGVAKALEPFELAKFKDRFSATLFPFMELDHEQRLQAMAVPLEEMKKEQQRPPYNVSLHWTEGYLQHWLEGKAGAEAGGDSMRSRIKEMVSSKKRPGSVRSMLTKSTSSCKEHGENLQHLLLHANEDGPTEMHRCDGVAQGTSGRGSAQSRGGAGEGPVPRGGGTGSSAGRDERRGAANGKSASFAAEPAVRQAIREQPQPKGAPADVGAKREAQAASSTERELALQDRLDQLELDAARLQARVAELERENGQLKRMLFAAALAVILLALALCYALAMPMLAVAKFTLVYMLPAVVSLGVFAVVFLWLVCEFGGETWMAGLACAGLELLRFAWAAAQQALLMTWGAIKLISGMFGIDPTSLATCLGLLLALMIITLFIGRWRKLADATERRALVSRHREAVAKLARMETECEKLKQQLAQAERARAQAVVERDEAYAKRNELDVRLQAALSFLSPPAAAPAEGPAAEEHEREQPTRISHTDPQEPQSGGLDQDDSPDDPQDETGQGDSRPSSNDSSLFEVPYNEAHDDIHAPFTAEAGAVVDEPSEVERVAANRYL